VPPSLGTATLPPAGPSSRDADATIAPSPATAAEPRDERAPPGYTIEKELGRGGMGVVYLARAVALNRPCALKMILSGAHSGAAEVLRFKTEAQAIARLQHPGIVQVFEIGEHDGRPFMALEFCPGGSLEAKLAKGPLAAKQAATLVKALAEAVQAAHVAQVLHRDLKPANVLLTETGAPKVTDFGLAKKLDEQGATRTGSVMGTPSYMPPEQAEGKKDIGPAADVYSLGAILYECLAARPPFRAATALDTLLQVLTEEPVPVRQLNAQAPVDLETICLKCLHKEPRKRYATARELADDLGRYLNGEPIRARPVGAVERAVKWARRNAVVSALAAAVFLVLLGGIVVSSYFALTARQEAKAAAEAKGLADRETARANAKAKEAETNLGVALLREKEAKKARGDAEHEAKEAKKARADAVREAAAGKAQARRAEDARHAIQIDLALRAREQFDYDRMGALLNEMRPEYHSVWETCHVRNLWLRHAFPIRSIISHTSWVVRVAFSPDGKRVLTGSEDKTARVWDAETGQQMALLKGHTTIVWHVAYSPDGKRILTSSDRTARVRDAETGQEKASLKGHTGDIVSVAFSPDGKRILTGSYDKTARVWDVETVGRALPAKQAGR
jgi:hypothetical protein